MINIYNSKIIDIFINNISLNNEKNRFIKKCSKSWYNLKKKKLKPNIFFFLIISKLRPIMNLIKIKNKKRRNSKIKRIPISLNFFKGYKKSIKLFLIPYFLNRKKNYKFNFLIENCFFIFLNKNKKNISLIRKKKLYFSFLKFRKFYRFK